MPEPHCATVKELLVDYVESELSEKLQSDIAGHLHTCSICQDEYKRMQELIKATKNLDVPEPGTEFWDTLPDKVLRQVTLARNQIQHGSNDSGQGPDAEHAPSVAEVVSINSARGGCSRRLSTLFSKTGVGLSMAAAVALSMLVLLQGQTHVQPMVQDPAAMISGIYQGQTSAGDLSGGLHSVLQGGNRMAFVDTVVTGRGFVLGGLYVESLALLHENKTDALLQHLQSMNKVLNEYRQPSAVSQLVSSLIAQVERNGLGDSANIQKQLAAIDKSLPELFLNGKTQSDSELQMYYAGVWLSSFALSTAAQTGHLGLFMEQLDGFMNRVSIVELPLGVEKSVLRIRELGGKIRLSKRDYRNILKEINNIRQLLS